MIEYIALGGAQEVGASCGILKIGDYRILVDAGMRPAARPGQSRTPDLNLLETMPPHAILITHAHIDHTGCIPLVAGMFPDIPLYATESTIALMRILLLDSARIMHMEHLDNELETPLYDQHQVEETLRRISPLAFNQPFMPLSEDADIEVQYLQAGHILGAGMLFFDTPFGTILHTGDISTGDHRTIKGVDLSRIPQADLMICEGTYGNRTHLSRKDQERGVVETVQAAINMGGHVLIPAFAVGRAQEVILILKAFRASGLLSPIKIFVDGMCKAVCNAYEQQSHDLHPSLQKYLQNSQRPLFMDPSFGVHAVSSKMRESLIAHPEPFVVISTSGMLSGGPAPIYAQAFAQSDRNAIIFTGYQDEEAPGALLLRTKQGDQITLNRQTVQLKCQVHRYSLSGHADAHQIEQVVRLVNPQHLILVHGDTQALTSLAQRFRKLEVSIPRSGDTTTLTVRSRSPRQAAENRVATLQPAAIVQPESLPEPTVAAFHEAVVARGIAQRPWTAIELGQCLYGPAYHPGLRSSIEQVLQQPAPYFKIRRLGSQKVYLPQSAEDIEAIVRRSTEIKAKNPTSQPMGLAPGMIVLVQGSGTGQGSARIAMLTGQPKDGRITLLAEGWKGLEHALNVIRIIPGIERPAWLEEDPATVKQLLTDWRTTIGNLQSDIIVLWQQASGMAQTFTELTSSLSSDDELLAHGLDLLRRGMLLWRNEGDLWVPKALDKLQERESIERHLRLLDQGNARIQHKNGELGTLTGRSGWGMVEVTWDSGSQPSYVKDRDVTVLAG
jgi:Cft2 family RNA processing exonuclease